LTFEDGLGKTIFVPYGEITDLGIVPTYVAANATPHIIKEEIDPRHSMATIRRTSELIALSDGRVFTKPGCNPAYDFKVQCAKIYLKTLEELGRKNSERSVKEKIRRRFGR
jgi:hypothetical protein